MNPHIFYQTKTKFTNTGDAFINKALIDALRPHGHLIVNDQIPLNFLDQLNVRDRELLKSNSIYSFSITVLFYALKTIFTNRRVYIFSGLGHNYGGSYKKIIRNILSGFLFSILRCFRVRIIRIGMSIGPITRTLGMSELFRSLFVNYYYVRDTKSLALCRSIGIKNVKLCPDLSWMYSVQEISLPDNIEPTIVVNLRNSTLDEFLIDSYTSKLMDKLVALLESIQKMYKERINVKVIYQVSEDRHFAEFVFNAIQNKFNVNFEKEQMSLLSAQKYYSKSLITISNRMHSLLFAYKFNSLPIALIDKKEHIKITSTFVDAKIDNLICDIQGSDEFKIEKIMKEREMYLKQIKTVEKEYQLQISMILNSFFDY